MFVYLCRYCVIGPTITAINSLSHKTTIAVNIIYLKECIQHYLIILYVAESRYYLLFKISKRNCILLADNIDGSMELLALVTCNRNTGNILQNIDRCLTQ